MNNSGKKTSTASSARKRTGTKRKRKKKLVLKDRVRAALIAGILISVTALVAVSLIVANSAVDNTEESPIIAETLPENNVPPKETVPRRENLPGENIPAEKSIAVREENPRKEEPVPQILPKEEPAPPEDELQVPRVESTKVEETKPVQIVSAPKPSGTIEQLPKVIPAMKGTVTLVMDDAGNNLRELDPFLAFSGPLTIAVLPGLPYSAEAARRIRSAGKEVILHQPMEALGGQNPGPGAVYTNMSDAEIRAVVEKNLADIGPVAGMNNHQGSKVTMDERVMEIILSICHDQGIYFLDSRTTADTVVPRIAGRRGTKIWERDVFLDNIQERAAMIRSFHEGLQKAEKKGGAIMIGHVWSSELAATLEELYPEMVEQGYSLSTISRFMMGMYDYDDPWD